MKYGFSIRTSGFSTTELMVALAIIGIVSVSVSRVFKNSIKHAAYNYQANKIISEKIRAIQIFRSDLTSSPSSSIGSLLTNGDFEQDSTGWPTNVTGSGTVTFTTQVTTTSIRSGIGALALASSDGSQVYVNSTNNLILTDGSAYYLTGFFRLANAGTIGGFALIDDSNQVVASATTSATTWSRIWIRFPAMGTYNTGDISNNRLRLRLFATGGTSTVNIDDLGFSPVQAVLADTVLPVNVPNSGSGGSSNPTGFRFQVNVEAGPIIYRYRVVSDNSELQLLREYYDEDANSWVSSDIPVVAQGFSSLQFLSPDPTQYAVRSRLPVEVSIGYPTGAYGKSEETVTAWSFASLVN